MNAVFIILIIWLAVTDVLVITSFIVTYKALKYKDSDYINGFSDGYDDGYREGKKEGKQEAKKETRKTKDK